LIDFSFVDFSFVDFFGEPQQKKRTESVRFFCCVGLSAPAPSPPASRVSFGASAAMRFAEG
jgi:hypothetical protein